MAAGPLEANLLLTGVNTTGTLYHIFGFLPGKSEEIIVIHTHHDGWAVNEASGAAVVMALAKYFAQFPKESRERTLLFVAFDSHFGKRSVGEFLGSVQPRIVAALVIEMIAKEFKIVEGEYYETGLVSSTHFGIPGGQPTLVSFVQEAVIKHHLDRSVGTPRTFGEGGVYATRGIPTIERIAISAPQFSNDDTPDKVMVDKLQPTAAAFVDIIRKMDATPRELLNLKPASDPDAAAANSVTGSVNLQPLKSLSVSKGIDYVAEYANNPRYPHYGGPYIYGTGTVVSDVMGDDGNPIHCGTDCSDRFNAGSLVTLTALPDPDSFFTGWSGDCMALQPCRMVMESDKSVTAYFGKKSQGPAYLFDKNELSDPEGLNLQIGTIFLDELDGHRVYRIPFWFDIGPPNWERPAPPSMDMMLFSMCPLIFLQKIKTF